MLGLIALGSNRYVRVTEIKTRDVLQKYGSNKHDEINDIKTNTWISLFNMIGISLAVDLHSLLSSGRNNHYESAANKRVYYFVFERSCTSFSYFKMSIAIFLLLQIRLMHSFKTQLEIADCRNENQNLLGK